MVLSSEYTKFYLLHVIFYYSSIISHFVPCYIHHHLQFIYSFKFTKIDPQNPDKPYTFALILDRETDRYEILDCNPTLHSKDIDTVVSVLNDDKDNGLNGCVVSMRRLFKETL